MGNLHYRICSVESAFAALRDGILKIFRSSHVLHPCKPVVFTKFEFWPPAVTMYYLVADNRSLHFGWVSKFIPVTITETTHMRAPLLMFEIICHNYYFYSFYYWHSYNFS